MDNTTNTHTLAYKGLLKIAIYILVLMAILFISSGRFYDWLMAWVYISLVVIITLISIKFMTADLIAERSQIKADAKNWDKILAALMARLGPMLTLIVAGLDQRFQWTPSLPITLQLVALVILILGAGLSIWAIASNNFFSGVVRIQTDRGHVVVNTGPYQYMRHPGYTGAILFELFTPVMLGSLWALIPAGFTVIITLIRTRLEDKTLQSELEGYQAYSQQVRYRLLPGIW